MSPEPTKPAPRLCLDCAHVSSAARCDVCRSLRRVAHPQLFELSVAHVDADAFYASVEKRDRPELATLPVLVGGGTRGVVTAACYIARTRGVRSAMPMFKALRACPDAVVIRPDFAKYSSASRALRELMQPLTPLLQALSIDEAVLDLSGTEVLHGASPAVMLARLAIEVERRLGITISVGLARNRLLAKLAAGLDKPRGFGVLGCEAREWLAGKPVRLLPGIGPALERRLWAKGFVRLGQLQGLSTTEALSRLGPDGPSLVGRARGEDSRAVSPGREVKSVSAETTFEADLSELAALERPLWRLCEKLCGRLRESGLCAGGIVLKLKTASFTGRTRSQLLPTPTVLPERLFEAARRLLAHEADGTRFRLIGIGAAPILALREADPIDLADPDGSRRVRTQAAIDSLRARYGREAVRRGRELG